MKNIILSFALTLFIPSYSGGTDLSVTGVSEPVISLNGKWKICNAGYNEISSARTKAPGWKDIDVPGEPMMQGFPVKHDIPFIYSRDIEIPDDFKDKTVIIRFEGVYSYARVWVDGNFIREHSGGFTAWECDITKFAGPGKRIKLYVEVTDRADEISYASGYAKHQIGGILRSVSLLALPGNHPEKLEITTDFDEKFEDATLTVKGLTVKESENCSVKIELFDPSDSEQAMQNKSAEITGKSFTIGNIIKTPVKWDAEHPFLYRLRISFAEGGKVVWRKDYHIGFREIQVIGNKFLVNGKEVKFRGACRHDIHPLLGRMSTPEYDLKDVQLAKEANMNFIRTSHYPPSEKFLEYCDMYGLFVECETAVCFVGSHRTKDYFPGATENSEEYSGRYLSQLEEMVDNFRNHPSVVMWSIGNENSFGTNFRRSYDWVKSNDLTRPVIFSYPGHVPDSITAYDVVSMHYPGTNGNMVQYDYKIEAFGNRVKPVIFDEWAHVPCYNQQTVSEDPAIRDFWGMSLDTMFQKVYDADGGLGGAIWGMIDETFMLPLDLPGYNEWWGKLDKNVIPANFTGHCIGYGEWGFIDTWRRKKPEFWSVKKAYSPVRILKTSGYETVSGKTIKIPVYNRFDFTNLNELTASLTLGETKISLKLPDIPPHSKGIIQAVIPEIEDKADLQLEFFGQQGELVDLYRFETSEMNSGITQSVSKTVSLTTVDTEYSVKCEDGTNLVFDRATGLISSFRKGELNHSFRGPYLNFRTMGQTMLSNADLVKTWKVISVSAETRDNEVVVTTKGLINRNIKADYSIKVNGDGTFVTEYSFSGLPAGLIREAGIQFMADNIFDTLSWKRDTYWKGYPYESLCGPEGRMPIFTEQNRQYRQEPQKEWIYEKKSFFYNGTGDETSDQLTNIARSTKAGIHEYSLEMKTGGSLSVTANADKSCRIAEENGNTRIIISDIVDYPDIAWGNYSANISLSSLTGKTVISFRQ
jgi:beta-galactosidase/beta-glucuronidase